MQKEERSFTWLPKLDKIGKDRKLLTYLLKFNSFNRLLTEIIGRSSNSKTRPEINVQKNLLEIVLATAASDFHKWCPRQFNGLTKFQCTDQMEKSALKQYIHFFNYPGNYICHLCNRSRITI